MHGIVTVLVLEMTIFRGGFYCGFFRWVLPKKKPGVFFWVGWVVANVDPKPGPKSNSNLNPNLNSSPLTLTPVISRKVKNYKRLSSTCFKA